MSFFLSPYCRYYLQSSFLPHGTGVSCGFFYAKIPPQAKWLAGGRITPKRELGYEEGYGCSLSTL